MDAQVKSSCLCPAGPRGYVSAEKLQPYRLVQQQQPRMQMLTPGDGAQKTHHSSYSLPPGPRPAVPISTSAFQVGRGETLREHLVFLFLYFLGIVRNMHMHCVHGWRVECGGFCAVVQMQSMNFISSFIVTQPWAYLPSDVPRVL